MQFPAAVPAESALVGREAERAALRSLLEGATHSGTTLTLIGPPGIGKSALLADTGRLAVDLGFGVVATRGTPAESQLPFAALHELVRPLLGRVPSLPPGHRRAILGAFGMSAMRRPPERLAIALATLELLADIAAERPVLVLVDDLQWVDPASRDIIDFVGRRVSTLPIVVAAATRRVPHGESEPGDPRHRLEIGALPGAAARSLLTGSFAELPLAVTERVLHYAAGNPLALLELPLTVRDDPPADQPLPLTPRLRQAFATPLTELDPMARTVLLVAALNDGDSLDEALTVAGRLAGTEVCYTALQDAEDADLVAVDGAALRFRHPVIRSSALHWAPDRHTAVHEALAELIEDADRLAWHRAAATTRPSEVVAAALDTAAAHLLWRGGAAAAEARLRRAAELSEDGASRSRRLLRAAGIAFERGRPATVASLVREAFDMEIDAAGRANALWLKGAFEDAPIGDHADVPRFIDGAVQVRLDGDIDLAARLLVSAAQRCYWSNARSALRDRVIEATFGLGLPVTDPRRLAVLALADPVARAGEVLAGLDAVDRTPVADPAALVLLGTAAYCVGDFERALDHVTAALPVLRQEGRLALSAQGLTTQALAATYLGCWEIARPSADEAHRLAVETAQSKMAAYARLAGAYLDGLQGFTERAEAAAAEVEEAAVMSGSASLANGVQLARGLAALGSGRPDVAFEELRRMVDRTDPAFHRGQNLFALDYLAEAAVITGATATARRDIAGLWPPRGVAVAPGVDRAVRLARAFLGDGIEVDRPPHGVTAFEIGLTAWQRARADLARGARLRRLRQRGRARVRLRTARVVFDRLGATAWSDRARHELLAAGERDSNRDTTAESALSPQELQIVRLAAGGMSNRDIGRLLFLSHRTVASHLYRAFPKLGVTSRAQLHVVLAEPGVSGVGG